MGRKSSLTPEQWAEVERRHLIDGQSVNSLAKEFGINEAAIRRKINPKKSEGKSHEKSLRLLAAEKIEAEKVLQGISESVSSLPMVRQRTFNALVEKLTTISHNLADAASYGASTAHRLAAMANSHLDKVDGVNPEASIETLKTVSALTKMANDSSEIPINLLRANKDLIDSAADDMKKSGDGGMTTLGLNAFYADIEKTEPKS